MASFIGVFEILAFKNFVDHNSLKTRIGVYSSLLNDVSESIQTLKDAWLEDRDYRLFKLNAGSHFFIWTEDASPLSFGQILATAQSLFAPALAAGFPRAAFDLRPSCINEPDDTDSQHLEIEGI